MGTREKERRIWGQDLQWGHRVGMAVVQEAQLLREVYQETLEDIAVLKQSARQR